MERSKIALCAATAAVLLFGAALPAVFAHPTKTGNCVMPNGVIGVHNLTASTEEEWHEECGRLREEWRSSRQQAQQPEPESEDDSGDSNSGDSSDSGRTHDVTVDCSGGGTVEGTGSTLRAAYDDAGEKCDRIRDSRKVEPAPEIDDELDEPDANADPWMYCRFEYGATTVRMRRSECIEARRIERETYEKQTAAREDDDATCSEKLGIRRDSCASRNRSGERNPGPQIQTVVRAPASCYDDPTAYGYDDAGYCS